MNTVEVIDVGHSIVSVREAIQSENRVLTEMIEQVSALKQSYDSLQLSKDIRVLQDATRIQNMSGEIRHLMLAELQRRKLIKQVIDGERL